MSVKIVLEGQGGKPVRVKLSTRRSVNLKINDVAEYSGVRIVVGAASGAGSVVIEVRNRSARAEAKRFRNPGTLVSAEMEAAAVRAFLGGADTVRLGRSLAEVFVAMDAVRRRTLALGNDPDES